MVTMATDLYNTILEAKAALIRSTAMAAFTVL